MKFTGQDNQGGRKLDLAEILKMNISKELYTVKIIEEVNGQKDILVNFQNYANELLDERNSANTWIYGVFKVLVDES